MVISVTLGVNVDKRDNPRLDKKMTSKCTVMR